MSIASKMGVYPSSISFEKIDILRDLETARAKLNEQTINEFENKVEIEEDAEPNLENQIHIGWLTAESEETCLIPVSSNKNIKKRSTKKSKVKLRVTGDQPIVGILNSEGDESKVHPRFKIHQKSLPMIAII